MDEPIEEVYFNWLYSKVASTKIPSPSNTYYTLLRELHSTEFFWLINGDDNRAQDGLGIRRMFFNKMRFSSEEELHWMNAGCSVLEMLIALAERAEFQTSIDRKTWFWKLLENLGFSEFSDSVVGFQQEVHDSLDRFIWRTYLKNGDGGLFPLQHTDRDQTKVEIWYQFFAYLDEHEEF